MPFLVTAIARLADWMERRALLVVAAFSICFLGVTWFLGATKLMQFDEIFTYYPSRQPIPELWSFFAEGLDVHTPILALMAHASMSVFGESHWALRLPVILGYWLLCVSVYAFVSYRCSNIYGLAAMMLPPITSVYFYATEIRPYGVLLGVSAFALVCWQRAFAPRDGVPQKHRFLWMAAWGITLVLCVSLHYFAVFLWIPFGLAGLVRDWQKRSIDWGMWLILVGSLFPLAVFFPMMQLARANFLSGIWSPPSLNDIEGAYRFMFTLAFSPMLGALIVWLIAGGGRQETDVPTKRGPLAERVLIGALALVPVYVVPIMLVGGTFVPRYVLYTLTGVTIFLATAIYNRARGNRVVAAVIVVCLGGWFMLKYPNMGRRQKAESHGLPFGNPQPLESKTWMKAIDAQPDLPVVLNPAVFYLHFQHYSPEPVRKRSYYLTSISDALRLDRTDTGDRNLLFFERRFPVQVPAYSDFVSQHRTFLLLAETTNPTWVMEKLLEDKADLQLLLRDNTYHLYRVTMPGS